MKTNEIEVFLHSSGAPASVLRLAEDERLVDGLIRAGVMTAETDEVFVFIGEGDEALLDEGEAEGSEDTHEAVNAHQKAKVLPLKHHDHVHVHYCKRIAVTVHHAGKEKHRKFSPAATIETVTKWARNRFKLTDAAANELVLQICNSTVQPRPDIRLGELKEVSGCAICFDLVPEVTNQG